MTKQNVNNLRIEIESLVFDGKKSKELLLGYEFKIKSVINYINQTEPQGLNSLYNSAGQLYESAVGLSTGGKESMSPDFRECKRDFLSVLDDYITRGNEYNLWENV